jgi:hypothetical protein
MAQEMKEREGGRIGRKEKLKRRNKRDIYG